jgi:hypothetical protein
MPKTLTDREEFDFKFNHFNDLYMGHKRNQKLPDCGKQICDGYCENVYDLDDVWDWIESKKKQWEEKAYLVGRMEMEQDALSNLQNQPPKLTQYQRDISPQKVNSNT